MLVITNTTIITITITYGDRGMVGAVRDGEYRPD